MNLTWLGSCLSWSPPEAQHHHRTWYIATFRKYSFYSEWISVSSSQNGDYCNDFIRFWLMLICRRRSSDVNFFFLKYKILAERCTNHNSVWTEAKWTRLHNHHPDQALQNLPYKSVLSLLLSLFPIWIQALLRFGSFPIFSLEVPVELCVWATVSLYMLPNFLWHSLYHTVIVLISLTCWSPPLIVESKHIRVPTTCRRHSISRWGIQISWCHFEPMETKTI